MRTVPFVDRLVHSEMMDVIELSSVVATRTCGGKPAFPDKQPIGIDRTGRAVFLYLVRPSTRDDFPGFLDRHREVLGCLPSWTLRPIFLRQFPNAYEAFQAVVREEWESPLHPRTVEELRWCFEQRRPSPSGVSDWAWMSASIAVNALDASQLQRVGHCSTRLISAAFFAAEQSGSD
jgi:hypothetical protein